LMYDLPGWNKPGRPASLGAIPAQIYKLVCLRIETFASSFHGKPQGQTTVGSHIKERHKFDRSTDTQRLSETGPPPTCPFIKTDNVKEPTRFLPRFVCTGYRLTDLRRRETNADPEGAASAAGGPYMDGSPSRQPAFCNCVTVKPVDQSAVIPRRASSAPDVDNISSSGFNLKWRKRMGFSAAPSAQRS